MHIRKQNYINKFEDNSINFKSSKQGNNNAHLQKCTKTSSLDILCEYRKTQVEIDSKKHGKYTDEAVLKQIEEAMDYFSQIGLGKSTQDELLAYFENL